MNSLCTSTPIALACALAVCKPTPASGQAAAAAFCPRVGNRAMVITEHGFGGLSFDSSLANLRRACPAARDTTIVGYEGDHVALLLPFRGASVVVYQNQKNSAKPADAWVIVGDSARLSNGLPLTSTWAAIHTAYGNRLFGGSDENNDTVWVGFTFCASPHLTFGLALVAEGAPAHPSNPDSVPPTVRIHDIGLERIPDPRVADACR